MLRKRFSATPTAGQAVSRVYKPFIFYVLLTFGSVQSPAQTADPQTAPGAPTVQLTEAELAEREQAKKILELEIKTSTLLELAELCRSLKLSEGGSREEIVARLRDYYGISRTASEIYEADQKVITIESARSTEYFTLNSVGEEYARLSGGVSISLKDGTAVHSIKAFEILYNRTRNIISATGNVVYVKEDGDTRETFKGETITINLDTWAGSFVDTIAERGLAGNDTAYQFEGQVISKTDTDTTVLTNAKITNAKTTENFWSLEAGKLWLLPGSDLLIFNAVLKVGNIPVLWLPAFPLLTDELVVHPAFGTKTREGTFVQTTTYFLGRPAADALAENSISKILGSGGGMEKVREGVFMRSTGKRETTVDGRKIALLADAYTNLGFYVGTNIIFPKKGFLDNINVDGGFGFTKTIYSTAGKFTPFDLTNNSKENWNTSYIFGAEVPFRFRLKLETAFFNGIVSLKLPIFSDPYIEYDIMNTKRLESFDYMKALKEAGTAATDEVTTPSANTYDWQLTIRPKLSVTNLAPYISTLSLGDISSTFHFKYKDAHYFDETGADKLVSSLQPTSPARVFYFPDKWTIYQVSGSIRGTPLTLSSDNAVKEKDPAREDPLKGFGTPRLPWTSTVNEQQQASTSLNNNFSLKPPALNKTFDIGRTNGFKLTWDYNLSPTSTTEMTFSSQDWRSSADIDLGDIKSILTKISGNASTTLTITEPNHNIYSLSGGLTGDATWQDNIYRNQNAEEYTPDTINTERSTNYNATYWRTSWQTSASISPFYWLPTLAKTTIRYELKGLMAKSNFLQDKFRDDINNSPAKDAQPQWDTIFGKFDKNDLDIHRLSTNLDIALFNQSQTVSASLDLPPEDSLFSLSATARLWISESTVSTKILKPFDEDASYQTLIAKETLRFTPKISFVQDVEYEPKYEQVSRIGSTLVIGGFNALFRMNYQPGSELARDSGGKVNGWKTRDADNLALRPIEFNMSYSRRFEFKDLWKKRLNFAIDLSTSLNFNLDRYTLSNFNFSLNFTFGISKFIDITLGTTSSNNEIYRYFKDMPFFSDLNGQIPISNNKETNLFIDLFNSFRFDNEELRKQSGFKIKSFNFSAVHHLGDWDAEFSIKMDPTWLDNSSSPPMYKFDTQISFVIRWLPISELKTDINYNGRLDKITHK
ncbi:hypothetical protein FACS1894190_07450 [Spirochaetia bacterium]|nr:hypothetical protein FACS1894190_07450 [Spirochaetia bacterium]